MADGIIANSTAAAFNPYKFCAYRNAAANTGNGAFAVIAFDTVEFDTNNNLASGVYTAPVAGFYQFNWQAQITQTGSPGLTLASLYKDGTRFKDGFQLTSNNVTTSSNGSCFIQLAAAAAIDIRVFATVTQALAVANAYDNYFSGFLVSRA